MKIAIIVFQDLTLLDLVGFTDAIQRLKSMQYYPNLEISYCAFEGDISDNFKFRLPVDLIKPDLSVFDMIFIPGGLGTRNLIHDTMFLDWIRSGKDIPLKISVCTGSLILGAAGFLENKRATTHFDEYDRLHQYTSQVVRADVVQDQGVVTGGAVATSLILGIHTCKILAGDEAANAIARRMGLPRIYLNADVQIY